MDTTDTTTTAPRGTKPFDAARLIPHTLLRPSPTNPRHWVDPVRDAELRESIRVQGVQVPLLVRVPDSPPADGEAPYEIVEGESRWRHVNVLAGSGVWDLPCVIRDLSAEQAQELQLLSAIQRNDLHPLDEADGFEALLADPPGKPARLRGYSVDELAHRMGKSPRYIYGRLALCALQRAARAAYYAGHISLGTAQALARLDATDQAEAVAHIVKGNGSGPLPADEAQQYIQRSYMLRLAQATWALHDATLLPAAGSCTTCNKRTGANPELFPDLSTPADTCADRRCYQAKAAAARQQVIDAAKAKGYTIISGDSARALLPTRTAALKGHYRLDEPCPIALSHKPLRDVLGKRLTSVVLVDNEAIGALVEVAPAAAVKRALQGAKLLREPDAKQRSSAKPAARPAAQAAPQATPTPTPAEPAPQPARPAPAAATARPAATDQAPDQAPDEDLQLIQEAEGLAAMIVEDLHGAQPDDKALAKAQRSGAALVRAILIACAIGRQMRTDQAEGLPAGIERMLLVLLVGMPLRTSWRTASQIAGVPLAPALSEHRAFDRFRDWEPWVRALSSEEACRLVMVALALQDPSGIESIAAFPLDAARALGTAIDHVDREAQRITREHIQLELLARAAEPHARKKAKPRKAAGKGAAA